jgi:hypothetical protein
MSSFEKKKIEMIAAAAADEVLKNASFTGDNFAADDATNLCDGDGSEFKCGNYE